MQAFLIGELPIIVYGCMQRHIGITNIMADISSIEQNTVFITAFECRGQFSLHINNMIRYIPVFQ